MLRVVLAIVGGIALAFSMVLATDFVFHSSAAGISPAANDKEAMRVYVASQPPGLLVAMVVGWTLAAFAGSALATRLGRRGTWPGWVVTVLFLAATVANFLLVTHPTWMVVNSVWLIVLAGWLGTKLAKGAAAAAPTQPHDP